MRSLTIIKNSLVLLVLSLILVKPAFSLGEGLYLKIKSDVPLTVSVDSSRCVEGVGKIAVNKKVYLESDTFTLDKCYVEFSLFNENQVKVAAYKINIASTSSAKNQFILAPYIQAVTLYPRYSYYPIDSTSLVIISITNNNPSQWMRSVSNAISDKQLNQIFIPGTHDTGTYAISKNSDLMPDAKAPIYYSQTYGGNLGASLNAGWAKTQVNDMEKQLNSGIRYFDLRLCGSGVEVENVYACHALQGESLVNIVKAAKEFLQQPGHDHEIIILDVNHWYNKDDKKLATMQENALSYIKNELEPWVAARKDQNSQDQYTPSTKLSSFWNDKKQVIIASTDIPKIPQFNFIWRSVNSDQFDDCDRQYTDLCSYWPNKQDPDRLKASIARTIQALRERSPNYLFVLQTQLTPSAQTIAAESSMVNATNLISLTGTYKDQIETYLQEDETLAGVRGLIFIEDFSNGIDLTRQVIKLNSR